MRAILPVIAIACAWGCAQGSWAAETLPSALAMIDRSAANFHGMTADLTEIAYTAVVSDSQVSSGKMKVKRDKPGDTRMLVDFTQPDPKDVQLQGQTLQIYLPRLKTVQIYELGKNSSLIEQFLLLGFGTSSKDLSATNDIQLEGSDSVNGHPAIKLLLTPKKPDVRSHVEKIELWLSPDTGYPLQHKIYQPGGDYQLFSFADLRINPPDLTDASVSLKLPKNVKTERPQH